MIRNIKALLGKWFGASFPKERMAGRGNPSATDDHSDTRANCIVSAESDPITHLVPYDENLLERSRTQWHFGDWATLSLLSRDTLQHHPDRAKLALLAAAGWHATGNMQEAQRFVKLASDWGCSKKLISQTLIAGVQNTLGRVAAINGRADKAWLHFKGAIRTGSPHGDLRLLTRARAIEQLLQLGLPPQTLDADVSAVASSSRMQIELDKSSISIQVLAHHVLGDGWASNSVNTVIFRCHGVLTASSQQYTAFYVDEQTLRLVQRNLVTGALVTHDLLGQYNLNDAHNSISLGLDRAGHLHVSYDHHVTNLRYRRSLRSHDITAWTDELPMTGIKEDRVTYPSFVLPHHGYPLTLLYRDGVHNSGNARIKTYCEETNQWSDHLTPILSGAGQRPWTSNAYWNHPAIGTDGSVHLSFVWRTHSVGDEKLVNNVNIGYARSTDGGQTWETSSQLPYNLPITQVNAETVYAVQPGSNLINQSGMALDSQNRPHIVFYSNDAEGIPQYQHLWFDGKAWCHQYISKRSSPFKLSGHGTLRIPISRPEIVIDADDNVYVIYRGDLTGDHMFASKLAAPDYLFCPSLTCALWPHALGYSEPIIDRSRWHQEQVLTMLLQENQQPDEDKGIKPSKSIVTLVDFKLS